MDDRPCQTYQSQLDEALHALQGIQASQQNAGGPTAAEGDFAQRFYHDRVRLTDAKRRYRAAVRALSECLSQEA